MSQPDLFRLPRKPWNAGRLTGAKAPLKPKHIWAIRQHLKSIGSIRDLAMFNIALDAKLRGCDLVHRGREMQPKRLNQKALRQMFSDQCATGSRFAELRHQALDRVPEPKAGTWFVDKRDVGKGAPTRLATARLKGPFRPGPCFSNAWPRPFQTA